FGAGRYDAASMKPDTSSFLSTLFPRHIRVLLGVYTLASLAHFAHNAEYIAYYPNMPAWITREGVYLAWLAIASVGLTGIVFALLSWHTAAALCIAIYGTLGLDGLGHYALALCSQHSYTMNVTIWLEAATGTVLALCALWHITPRVIRNRRVST
ncbi:hypothetical protein ACQV5M_19170, partial [Leptospira sp. SA-E8]|uniref:hypothetical protein n=1 Tax=Leptospira sp. SA-E8 TaxID=3422259 RepID=UPI003EB6D994